MFNTILNDRFKVFLIRRLQTNLNIKVHSNINYSIDESAYTNIHLKFYFSIIIPIMNRLKFNKRILKNV